MTSRKPRSLAPADIAARIPALALDYLAAASLSEAELHRKLARRAKAGKDAAPEIEAAIEAAIAKTIADLKRQGLIDDRRFALARAAFLHREGHSSLAIRAKLAAAGLARDLIAESLSALAAEAPDDLDLIAARRYLERRRLGPYRRTGDDADADKNRRQAFAALARAGFSLETARAALGPDRGRDRGRDRDRDRDGDEPFD